MAGALLVPHEDVPHLLLLKQLVIDRQHRPAGITEDVQHAIVPERLHHHFRTGHLAAFTLSVAHLRFP